MHEYAYLVGPELNNPRHDLSQSFPVGEILTSAILRTLDQVEAHLHCPYFELCVTAPESCRDLRSHLQVHVHVAGPAESPHARYARNRHKQIYPATAPTTSQPLTLASPFLPAL